MREWSPVLLGVLILGGAAIWWATLRVIRSSRELSGILRRLAEGDYRPVILAGKSPLFEAPLRNIRLLAETLDRQKTLLAREEFSIATILGSMTEGIVITGADLRIRLVNRAAEEMFGLRGGVTAVPLADALLNHEILALAARASSTGVSQRGELTLGGSGANDRRHLVVVAAPLGTPGGPPPGGLLLVLHDVTRLRELESVRRQFVANVSHEFRTPLSVINGYLETLEESDLSEEMIRKSVSAMRRHGDRLNRLIEDLLTISRMEEKGVRLEKEPVDPAPLLRAVIQQMETEISQRGVQLRLELPPALPAVELDAYQIEQAFSNLLVNAIRHGTVRGVGGHVRITAVVEGSEFRVRFEDKGPGIPLQDQEHLFERFYRVGGDRARLSGGTGLGLSIVKNIVAAHGGRVTVESRPGEGSCFSVFLPLTPS